MKRVAKYLGAISAAIVLIGLGYAGGSTASPRPAKGEVSQVTAYNDGFSDAKADDCTQGFTAACDWLKGGK